MSLNEWMNGQAVDLEMPFIQPKLIFDVEPSVHDT